MGRIIKKILSRPQKKKKMITWSGFKCFICAAVLYHLSRRTGRDVEFLKSVTRVDQLKDLAQLLEEERNVEPLIIAVSGTVGSETSIKCERSDMLGVILEETEELHFLKRKWNFSWVQDSASIRLPMSKEVPWYLDDGTGRVNVAGAQSAIGFELTVGSEVFEKPEPSSLVQGTLDYLQGLKMLGVRRIEHVLPIDTWLTVVGEAVKDGIGNVMIQKPEQGSFYVSPRPLDQLIPELGNWSRRFKYTSMGASIVLTVRGVIIISKPVVKYIAHVIDDILFMIVIGLKWHMVFLKPYVAHSLTKAKYLCRRSLDAATKRLKQVIKGERKHENISDGDATGICVICLERNSDAAFDECGHLCCCMTCSLHLEICPLCRRPIKKVLKIYGH